MTNTAVPSASSAAAPSLQILGDRDLYRELFKRARRRVRYHEDAEDITQETLLKASRYIEAFEGRASLRTWLWCIEDGCIADFYRSTRHNADRVDLTDSDGAPRDIDQVCESADPSPLRLIENAERLAEAWGVIKGRERAALSLQCEQGLSAREIAGEMGSTEGAVRVLLCKARNRLKRRLAA